MNIFRGSWKSLFDKNPKAIAIGNFDGVHLGHQRLIREVLKKDLNKCVLTFHPHPLKVLNPQKAPPLITPLEEKLRVLSLLGVEKAFVLEFDREFSCLTPEAFAREVILDRLNAKFITVGENFRFGKDRSGDAKLLAELGEKLGFEVKICPAVLLSGMPVSSTRIRRVIRSGDVELAWRLLGRPFRLTGKVVKGEGRGKSLGFPTANIEPFTEIIPQNGVYAVFVDLNASLKRGVMNIGFKPTFSGKKLTLEVFIMDFSGDIYGREIGIYFVKRLRSEKRFDNIEQLKEAIARDVACAAKILSWDMLSLFYSFFSAPHLQPSSPKKA